MLAAQDLPNDVEALKALVLSRQQEICAKETVISAKQDQIQTLEKLVADFKRALFGARSEKVNPGQYQLALEDIEAAIEASHATVEETEKQAGSESNQKRKRQTNRGQLPKHLERIEEIIEPDTKICHCGCERHVIGEDTSERLNIVPAKFQVIVTRRPKYACRACEDGIEQSPAPASLVPSGLPTEATLAHILVSKYADHLPLYRQAQIFARQGIHLDRSTLASWVGRAGVALEPVYQALLADLKSSTKLFMDETVAPVLDPGKGKTRQGYFWALARDDRPWLGEDPPAVIYSFAPGRSGSHAKKILENYAPVGKRATILQVDGYAGYNQLLRTTNDGPAQDISLAYCWAHARRKLFEVSKAKITPLADQGLKLIAQLYGVEKNLRGQTADQRLAGRAEQSKPLIETLRTWLDQTLAKVSAKSPLGEACKYMAKFWDSLCLFLTDGRIELDNNAVERSIRPIALNRKNTLFAGHNKGAENWATIASLIETCKLNDINPFAYLNKVLRTLVLTQNPNYTDLLPWNIQLTD